MLLLLTLEQVRASGRGLNRRSRELLEQANRTLPFLMGQIRG